MDYSIKRNSDGTRIESYGRLTAAGVPDFGWQVRTYPDGRRIEEHFSRGTLNGPRLNKFPDGDFRIAVYRNGKEAGPREYWYANGRKWQEAEMKNNEMDGPGREWYRSGRPKSVFRFKSGKLIEHVEWDEKGNLLKRAPNDA